MPEQYEKLAEIFVNYSCEVKKGELVIIHCIDNIPEAMIKKIVDKICLAGGLPMVWLEKSRITREILLNGTKQIIEAYTDHELKTMQKAKAYIAIRAYENTAEMSDIPKEKMALYKKHWLDPVHLKERVGNTKWVVSRWPSPSMAQKFKQSTSAFEKFYFDVCANVDYEKMSKDMEGLVKLMQKTDQVKIIGPGKTNLSFSIKGIPTIKCAGKRNIPDGEVFTAPVKNSVNGILEYNTSTVYEGKEFSGIKLEFRDGKIIKADCETGDKKALNDILDTDEGSRYIGEFALGVNPKIKEPTGEILFDEKIAGSFHFTPGASYDEAPNTNKSKVHWDLVCMQTPKYGGGEIYFDNKLIRKNGLFVLPELKALNPKK